MSVKKHNLEVIEGSARYNRALQTTDSNATFMPIETLSLKDKEAAHTYLQRAEIEGTVIGAIKGATSWDIRPVFSALDERQRSELHVLRMSNPDLILEASKRDTLLKTYQTIASRSDLPTGYKKHGAIHGQLWSTRTFTTKTLADSAIQLQGHLSHAAQFAQALILLIHEFHTAGIIHGHITPANLIVINGKLHLVDAGFGSSCANTANSFAPEVARGDTPSHLSDVWGLGFTLKSLFGTESFVKLPGLITQICSQSQIERPSMSRLADIFGVELPVESSSPKKAVKSDSLKKLDSGNISEMKIEDLATTNVISSGKFERNIPSDILEAVRTGTVVEKKETVFERVVSEEEKALASKSNAPIWALALVALSIFGYAVYDKSYTRIIPQINSQVSPQHSQQVNNQSKDLTQAPKIHSEKHFADYWKSGSLDLARIVAIEATKKTPSFEAQKVIIQGALRSAHAGDTASNGIRANLIQNALDARWIDSLTSDDRRAAIALAASHLVDFQKIELPSLTTVHPAIVYALAASLPIESTIAGLEKVSTNSLSSLQEVGPYFKQLHASQTTSMSDKKARALAKLLSGDMKALRHFLSGESSHVLQSVVQLLDHEKGEQIAHETLTHFQDRADVVGEAARWFEGRPLWEKTSALTKVSLLAGGNVFKVLSKEQTQDLITFPGSKIQQKAKAKIEQSLGEFGAALTGAVQPQSFAQFADAISKRDVAFITKWIESKPKSKQVLELLSKSSKLGEGHPFNVLAGSYLSKLKVKFSSSAIKMLATHPEPMVRTVAYAQLDALNPHERAVVEGYSEIEPDQRLKKFLDEKLEIARELMAIQ